MREIWDAIEYIATARGRAGRMSIGPGVFVPVVGPSGAGSLSYGIPAAVDDAIRAGAVVVANLSRASVKAAARRYDHVLPVLVSVSTEVLAARLAARGRETEQEIAQRIARNAAYADFGEHCHIVDNSGALEEAGDTLVRLLRQATARAT